MKVTTVCVLVAVLLCSAAVADAAIQTFATTCARCKSIGAKNCGYGRPNVVACNGQVVIRNCADCKARQGRCVQSGNSECYLPA